MLPFLCPACRAKAAWKVHTPVPQPPSSCLTAKQEDEKVIPAVKNAAHWGQGNTDPKLWDNFPLKANPPHFTTRIEDLRATVKKLPAEVIADNNIPTTRQHRSSRISCSLTSQVTRLHKLSSCWTSHSSRMNLEPANTRAGVLSRVEGRRQLVEKEIKPHLI